MIFIFIFFKKWRWKFKDEDESHAQLVEARNNLENIIYSAKSTLNNKDIEGKIDETDKISVLKKAEEIQSWFESNCNATKQEYDNKIKEFEQVFHPIMSKVYQAGGMPAGMPGGMPGGMPDGMPDIPNMNSFDPGVSNVD